MTASDMPPALSSMWRLCKLGYRHEPGLIVAAFLLALVAAVPDALITLWIAWLPKMLLISCIGLALSAVATWLLRILSARVQRRFRDKVTIALETHVAHLQASIATIEHHERPEYLDRLSVLRSQVFVLDHMYMSLFSTCGWILRLGVTVGLLMSVDLRLVLLAVFALPPVLTSSWRPAVERVAQERGAPHGRLARHLFQTATTAAPGKEVRVIGVGPRLMEERRAAWERWFAPVAHAVNVSAVWHALAWAVFGSAYIGAVAMVLHRPQTDVLLVLAAGARLSAYVGAAVGEIGFLRGIWMDGARRLAWLEDFAASFDVRADAPVPAQLTEGIRFDHVSFAYPGTKRQVLEDITLHLPAGSVVAIVGENGAGKTTLVKLLARMYEPSSGRILIDGTELCRLPPKQWRDRMSGAFQDFFRFELLARHSVGVGELSRMDEPGAVEAAVERAGAQDVVARWPAGLKTQLGKEWPQGVEVSFGQWQKLALGRGLMREHPLLLVLDEPTSALDAETEHAIFERFAAQARDPHGVTMLVSHRFSTVRMADLIVVLVGSKVAEVGSHDDLMARRGPYAELYTIQSDMFVR